MRDKREKFVELAEKRVNRTIEDLRLIGNLANRRNYSYSEDDVRKIVAVLDAELRLLKKRFTSEVSESRPVFRLD